MKDLTASLTQMGFENFLFLGRYKDGRIETARSGLLDQTFVEFFMRLLSSADAHKELVNFCQFGFLLFGLIVSGATHQCAFCGLQITKKGERYFPSCRCQLAAMRRMLSDSGVSIEDILSQYKLH